jgi:hypothetical protein|nr:MAG TPA: hypothetical protein [Caudoviricetes sp.]
MIKLYYYTNDNVAEFKFAGNAILSALDLAQYKVLKAQSLGVSAVSSLSNIAIRELTLSAAAEIYKRKVTLEVQESDTSYRYRSDAWTETTGTMTYTGGKWRISGDVVNPVENYELRAYNAMDWFQGVNSVDDMLTPDSTGKPIWLTYFESRYPDNDDLNAAYKDGRKVPYQLYKWLEWCQKCNP